LISVLWNISQDRVYFQVRGSNIHKTVIFDVISRILEASGGRWASDWSLGECVIFLICVVLVKLTFRLINRWIKLKFGHLVHNMLFCGLTGWIVD